MHYFIAQAACACESVDMKENKNSTKQNKVVVFREADGWHWSPMELGYLDARGRAYPTRKDALKAANDYYNRNEN